MRFSISPISQPGGPMVAASNTPDVAEGYGEPDTNLANVEFPTMDRARERYHSPAYAGALKIAQTEMNRRLVFSEGYPSSPWLSALMPPGSATMAVERHVVGHRVPADRAGNRARACCGMPPAICGTGGLSGARTRTDLVISRTRTFTGPSRTDRWGPLSGTRRPGPPALRPDGPAAHGVRGPPQPPCMKITPALAGADWQAAWS
ncbi:DUF1330 domain-containing protein [Streptomyces sp. NPDC007875]|uniref:DUF1330 domain-containing protein n=1 Tax=Streptomyces sp. NPDC007875 TaxID=3364783 RepID=UPI00367A727C